MEAEVETMTDRLRPFWGRIMVIPSDHDSETTHSGIIVPFVHSESPVRRGVVVHVDRAHGADQGEAMREIGPGTVVWFIGGMKVLDSIMLLPPEVVGYEVAE